MRSVRTFACCTVALFAVAQAAAAQEPEGAVSEVDADDVVVTGVLNAGTKTETPLIELPQPITIIPADRYQSQGASATR